MNITMENFKTAKYDVFSIFDDRWGLCTAGTPREYIHGFVEQIRQDAQKHRNL